MKEYSSYIKHHGILGQKWGVRRYQNNDGSLTEEGKKRYSKKVSEMSNEELRKNVDRLRLENEYKRLATPQYISSGKKWIAKNAQAIFSGILVGVTVEVGKRYIKEKIEKI